MPLAGGLPTRRTCDGEPRPSSAGRRTARSSTRPAPRHAARPPARAPRPQDGEPDAPPPGQATEGSLRRLRPDALLHRAAVPGERHQALQGRHGAQDLEARRGRRRGRPPDRATIAGTSQTPMSWNGRVYFVSDRDGTMNLWSMDDERQRPAAAHAPRGLGRAATRRSPTGASSTSSAPTCGSTTSPPTRDARSADHAWPPTSTSCARAGSRSRWTTSPRRTCRPTATASPSPRAARSSWRRRSRGAWCEATAQARRALPRRPLPARRQVACSPSPTRPARSSSGSLPANGVGEPERAHQRRQGPALRRRPLARRQVDRLTDKNHELWLLERRTKARRSSSPANRGAFGDLAWSPDSRWLAFVAAAAEHASARSSSTTSRDAETTPVTSDRATATAPAWSPDGQWLYFLSDRNLGRWSAAPGGRASPSRIFDQPTKIYAAGAARRGSARRSQPADELHRRRRRSRRPDRTTRRAEQRPARRTKPRGKGSKQAAGAESSDDRARGHRRRASRRCPCRPATTSA